MHAQALDERTLRVLVVDDSDDGRLALVQLLRAFGCEVISASDGYQALELIGTSALVIDLAIVDMQMPGLSGTQTLRLLREYDCDLPAIFISGRSQCLFKEELEQISNSVFLQKPVALSDLSKAIERANP